MRRSVLAVWLMVSILCSGCQFPYKDTLQQKYDRNYEQARKERALRENLKPEEQDETRRNLDQPWKVKAKKENPDHSKEQQSSSKKMKDENRTDEKTHQ